MNIDIKYYECGFCKHWMTDDCPKERLWEDGRKRGPHSSARPCDKFEQRIYHQENKPEGLEEK